MKANEVREKSAQELHKLETELREELFRLRLKAAMGRLEKTANLRHVRKDLARVLTIRRQKQVTV